MFELSTTDNETLSDEIDIESIKKQLLAAVTELRSAPEETRERMEAMHQQVVEHDVEAWAKSFLTCLERHA